MDLKSQNKIITQGFTILRVDDYPAIRIRYKDQEHLEWKEFVSFSTKEDRDKVLEELLARPNFILD